MTTNRLRAGKTPSEWPWNLERGGGERKKSVGGLVGRGVDIRLRHGTRSEKRRRQARTDGENVPRFGTPPPPDPSVPTIVARKRVDGEADVQERGRHRCPLFRRHPAHHARGRGGSTRFARNRRVSRCIPNRTRETFALRLRRDLGRKRGEGRKGGGGGAVEPPGDGDIERGARTARACFATRTSHRFMCESLSLPSVKNERAPMIAFLHRGTNKNVTSRNGGVTHIQCAVQGIARAFKMKEIFSC